jgi:hypothetical protein
MAIVRDLPFTLEAMESRSLITCSTGSQVFSGSTANSYPSSNGSTGVLGRIIDRLGDINAQLSQRYAVAAPFVCLWSSRGSTEADRKLTLGLQLQHGDSSGGGDFEALSTEADPDDAVFFTSARTTPESNWSTGVLNGFASNPCIYDLRKAKRYLGVLVKAAKNKVTTESSGDEGARLSAGITFMGAEQLPANPWTSQGSTSTST